MTLPELFLAAVVGTLAGTVSSSWCARRLYRRSDDTPRSNSQPRWLILATPTVVVAWAWVLSGPGGPWAPSAWPLGFVAIGVASTWLVAAEIDRDVHRIPDAITLTTWPVFALTLAVTMVLGAVAVEDVARALMASFGLAATAFVIGLLSGGVGLGDVKLLAGVGLILGAMSWMTVAVAVALICLIGAGASLFLLISGRAGLSARLAAGPGIVAGAVVAPVLIRLLNR